MALAATLLAAPAWAADEPDELVAGTITVIKPGRLAKFVAKPAGADLPNRPDSDPTVEGGSLAVFDTVAGAGDDVWALPAAGWKGLGKPAGSKGFKYKGAGSPADPCTVVLVKPAVVKAVCKGAGVTLTPPFAGTVGVVLTVGTDSKRYCLEFGGDDTKNVAGLLKRKNAPAPGACPTPGLPTTTSTSSSTSTTTSSTTSTTAPPVCGNGAVEIGEQCDDGNTTPGDGCNALCESEAGTCNANTPVIGTRTVTVDIDTPEPLAGVQVTLEYPQIQISIPGSGGSSLVQSRVTVHQVGGLTGINDLDTDLRVVLANATPFIDTGALFTIEFDECVDRDLNICNRNQNVTGCCANDEVCQGDLVTPCTTDSDCTGPGGPCVFDPACMFNPPVCSTANFPPPTQTGMCVTPTGGCPADNVCVIQAENTACSLSDPVDQLGQPVAGVTCSVTVASPSGAFLDDLGL